MANTQDRDQSIFRLNEILKDDELIDLFSEIRNVSIEIDGMIIESEKSDELKDSDEYQDMIDSLQDELLGMVLELVNSRLIKILKNSMSQ